MIISILGSGSFGTALAQVLSRNNDVNLIARSNDLIESINLNHQNNVYFPSFTLNKNIKATSDYTVVKDSDVVILAIPSNSILDQFEVIKNYLKEETLIINTAKGFAKKSETILSVLKKYHNNSFSILGPTFASNLLKGEYSAFTVASDNIEDFHIAKEMFINTNVILDYSENYKLIEFASILKNIFAIANGLYSALDDGINTKYAFLTQSYKEMNFILDSIFGNIKNDYYKNGVFGDLLLTSLNDQSRNKTLGQLIGRGFYKINDKSSVTLEGVRSTRKIYKLIKNKNLDCPIVKFVYSVLKGKNVYKQYNLCIESLTK